MTLEPSARFPPACVRFLLFLWLVLMGGASGEAQVVQIKPRASACDRSLVDAAMEVSGLKEMGNLMSAEVGPMFAQMEQTLHARGRRLPARERGEVLAIMQQAFAPEAVDQEIERSMQSQCEPKNFAASVERLRAPVAVKMRGLEDQFNRSHSAAALTRYAAALEQHPPTATREALAEAMENTIHNADFTADVRAQVVLAIDMVITGKATDDRQLREIRDRLMPAARKGARLEFLMVYRNASDEEVDQYIMLLRTPELRRFQTIYKSAVENAILRRTQVLAAMIKQYLDARASAR